ncbi:hypothetical protein [Endozoicomonas sp. ALD040]|uniref:hypothetical protein n=1 Tax=Endozoicomonas sp. ALD040 TaxID=3403079 RepID=UPI003BAFDD01
MSVKPKPKPQTTEINNIRNTLADVIDGLGQTRGEMHQRFDQQDKRFDQQEKRFDQQEKRFDQQDKRFDQQDKRFDQQGSDIAAIKEMLQVLLSRQ